MESSDFTTAEHTGAGQRSFSLLWRFVRSLPLLRRLAIPALLCAILGTAGYQIFIWFSGEYSKCELSQQCLIEVPMLNWQISLTYLVLALTALLVVSVRVAGWIFFEVGGQLASLSLFTRMVRGVGQVRTTFFDEFPSGRLINRLVRDFDSLRTMGSIRIGDTLNALIEILVLSAVIFLAHPIAAVAVFPVLGVFFYIQRNVAPMLQRAITIRSVRLGEVLHRETDVMEGVRTFKLYGHEVTLFSRLRDAVSEFVQIHYMRNRIDAWGRFWAQASSATYGFIALVFVSYAVHGGHISAVLGAVVISAVFRLSGTFAWLSWSSGLLFESAAHARRVFEYVDLPNESSEEGKTAVEAELVPGATLSGDLEFVHYSMSYRANTPVILADLNLTIKQGSKVGIVGRTGSGKTSMLQALYRMVYVQGGDIRVGGRSLFSLPIEESRKLFGVVPQDPYLFEGTIRSNLDRYNEHTDDRLKTALATVQLSFDLNHPIQEGGKNLSLGQRQLVCLARVMINERPFIIMDEPTSGVDTITDAIIQKVLRTALADRTVITIAHRLETLARMDRIVELSEGRVVSAGE